MNAKTYGTKCDEARYAKLGEAVHATIASGAGCDLYVFTAAGEKVSRKGSRKIAGYATCEHGR